MTLKFCGHACFVITGSDGTRVVIDPYEPGAFGNALGYGPLNEAADVVLVTHDHADHNFVRGVGGNPAVCRQTCELSGVRFTVTPAAHDDAEGRRRGQVNMFSFALDGVRLCHLGDLGTALSPAQVAAVGHADVLMVPVGGTYTLDAAGAWQVVGQLQPRVVIPMHYLTAKTAMPLSPLDAFTNGHENVVRDGVSTVELNRANLPAEQRVIVLEPSC
jgi:L-ascorbate metabolism protein UlaG (beta-lactamase superfamily)